MDLTNKPMFEVGSSVFLPEMESVMEFLSQRINEKPGAIIIEGHTDALRFKGQEKTNWELSMERASAARKSLVKNGVHEKRFIRIVAYGASEPANPKNLMDPINRRINIIIMNNEDNKKLAEENKKIAMENKGNEENTASH